MYQMDMHVLPAHYFMGLVEEETPKLIAVGGGPASGKTTWRKRIAGDLGKCFLHDMDEVMLRLPGYLADREAMDPQEAFEKWWPFARMLSEEWVSIAIESRFSILYDRTCGAESSLEHLKRAKEKGYFVRLIGLTVDRPLATERAKQRELKEGRAVTEAVIDEYRARFSALWPEYLAFVDEAFLYDTSEDPPRLIYSTKERVLDPAGYQKFMDEGAPYRKE